MRAAETKVADAGDGARTPPDYPAGIFVGRDGTWLLRFPDLPEATVTGADRDDVLAKARDALDGALLGRVARGETWPEPDATAAEIMVSPSAESCAQIAVVLAFRRSGLTRTALAAKLGVFEGEVRRILDPGHRTKLGRLERVAEALGGRLRVTYVDTPS